MLTNQNVYQLRHPTLHPTLQFRRQRTAGSRTALCAAAWDSAAADAYPLPGSSEITSTSNAYVRHCVKLRESRDYRDSVGTVVVAGADLLQEIAALHSSPPPPPPLPSSAPSAPSAPAAAAASSAATTSPAASPAAARGGRASAAGPAAGRAPAAGGRGLRARVLILGLGHAPPPGLMADRTVWASEEVLRRVAGVPSGGGLCAVAELYRPRVERAPSAQLAAAAGRVLVLDGVQDPGNVGTLLRTAAAFRCGAALLLPGCCDPWNDKALRAAKGAGFSLPLWACSAAQLAALKAQAGLSLLAADPRAGSGSLQRALSARSAGGGGAGAEGRGGDGGRAPWLVLGSEGQGLSAEVAELCEPVSIPLAGGMESVNVGVAGGILLYLLAAHDEQQQHQHSSNESV